MTDCVCMSWETSPQTPLLPERGFEAQEFPLDSSTPTPPSLEGKGAGGLGLSSVANTR